MTTTVWFWEWYVGNIGNIPGWRKTPPCTKRVINDEKWNTPQHHSLSFELCQNEICQTIVEMTKTSYRYLVDITKHILKYFLRIKTLITCYTLFTMNSYLRSIRISKRLSCEETNVNVRQFNKVTRLLFINKRGSAHPPQSRSVCSCPPLLLSTLK